jgi:hypothetical protein
MLIQLTADKEYIDAVQAIVDECGRSVSIKITIDEVLRKEKVGERGRRKYKTGHSNHE